MWKYSFPFQLSVLKADQFSMLGQLSLYNHTAGLGFPLLLTFLFSSAKPNPQPPVALPQKDIFASQCQYAKASLASHNQEARPLLAMIILTVLLSPHIICHLSHCTSPP